MRKERCSLLRTGYDDNILARSVKVSPFCAGPRNPDAEEGCALSHHLVAFDGRVVTYTHRRWGSFQYDLAKGVNEEIAIPIRPAETSSRGNFISSISKQKQSCGFDCSYDYMTVRLAKGGSANLFVNHPDPIPTARNIVWESGDGVREFLFWDKDIVYARDDGVYYYSFDPERLSAVRRSATGRLALLSGAALRYWIGTAPRPVSCSNLASLEKTERCIMESIASLSSSDVRTCGVAVPLIVPAYEDLPRYVSACQAYEEALRDGSPERCRQMVLYGEHCFAHVAFLRHNPAICDQIPNAYPREACKVFVAEGAP